MARLLCALLLVEKSLQYKHTTNNIAEARSTGVWLQRKVASMLRKESCGTCQATRSANCFPLLLTNERAWRASICSTAAASCASVDATASRARSTSWFTFRRSCFAACNFSSSDAAYNWVLRSWLAVASAQRALAGAATLCDVDVSFGVAV
jgi:hypothetical protein